MTKFEMSRDESNERGVILLEANDTDLQTITLYPPLKTKLDNKMTLCRAAKQRQYDQTGYITTDKGVLHAIMVGVIFTNIGNSCVQAYNLGKPDLAKALDKNLTYLTSGSFARSVGRCTELLNFIIANNTTLTIVTPADVTAMTKAIKDFNTIINMPKSEIKARKAEGTDPIPGLLNDVDEIKYFIGKLLHAQRPDLAHKWDDEIKVGSPTGVRHTSIAVQYTDSETGVPIKNVKTTLDNGVNKYIKTSSKNGWSRAYSLSSDNYSVTSEHASFVTDTKTGIGINNRKMVTLFIKLQKKTITTGGGSSTDPEATTGILSTFVFIKSSGEPQPGVQISIPDLNYVNTTDEDGEDYLDEIKPGSYVGTIYLEGYNPIPFNIVIVAGQTLIQKFYLEPASAPDNNTPNS